MAVVEVSYGMTIVIVGLVVSVVPVPVVTAEVTPASALVADTAFPTRIKVTTTDVYVTCGTMIYHYMRTGCYMNRTHIVMANIVMATHIVMAGRTVHLYAVSVVTLTSSATCVCVNTCHAHHGYHYHHHVKVIALHNRIV
jgi:hypothetical protein